MPAAALAFFHNEPGPANQELQTVIAELDRANPFWRLADIEARRDKIPAKENGALSILAAYEKLPEGWDDNVRGKISIRIPPQRLTAKQAEVLAKTLVRCQASLTEAKKVERMEKGRFPVKWPANGFDPVYKQHFEALEAVRFLQLYSAIHYSQNDKQEEAWKCMLRIWKMNNCLGDEPSHFSQSQRADLLHFASLTMEWILAQGEVKEESLAQSQKMIEREKVEPLLLSAIRGERALLHRLYTRLAARDKKTVNMLHKDIGKLPVQKFLFWEKKFKFEGDAVKPLHAFVLGQYTKALELVKPSLFENYRKLTDLEAKENAFFKEHNEYARTLVGGDVGAVVRDYLRLQSQLHCTRIGLACERFRLRHKRWPGDLKELVEFGLVARIPIDVYDGKPLRLRKTANGIIVYSVGDGIWKNKGDSLDNPDQRAWFYSQFRLWNMDKRRQPPRPATKAEIDRPKGG